MPLDIQLLRDPKGILEVKESQRRRLKSPDVVDEILRLDNEWKRISHERDELNGQVNKLSKTFQNTPPAEIDTLKTKIKAIKAQIDKLEEETPYAQEARDKLLNTIGNLVHSSVPVSGDERDNVIVASWGKCQRTGNEMHHHELMHMIDGYDSPRGVIVAGHRGYFLKGVGVLLNQALINFGLNFLMQRQYTPLQPPYFMNKNIMAETAQLEQFDEELYKVSTGVAGEEKYLIATSEQPISAFHREEWLDPFKLPFRYAGISSCFRKEAGSHGRDAWGIFRIHQFEKVEQFCVTSPEDSWKMQEEMIQASQDFYRALGIPYRVVNIVSGELNNAAAKKYDLEAWFPTLGVFRELVSCSNCTDYQARAMETRFGTKKAGDHGKSYAHMLNATLCATERTICCLLENYQTETGIVVPKALVPFMNGMTFLKFVNKPPTNRNKEKQEKAAGKEEVNEKPANEAATQNADSEKKSNKVKKPKEKQVAENTAAQAPLPIVQSGTRAQSQAVAQPASVRAPSPSVKPSARAPSPSVQSSTESGDIEAEVKKQADIVRDLKAKKGPPDQVKAAVDILLKLKQKLPQQSQTAVPVKKGKK